MRVDIKERDMERLSLYRNELMNSPRLIYLFFELTDACNLSCLHCGSSACPQNKTYLPVCDIERVLQSVASRYNPAEIMVCLTGGEPLLHRDFFKISAYAKELGFSCGMTTNATLITEEIAHKMIPNGMRSVTVSLDGLEDSHDWFRNSTGSFTKTVSGIKNLMHATRGAISTQITTVVHKKNFHELDRIYDLVVSLGVASWRVINLEPIGRALDHRDLLLNASELRFLLDYIRNKRFDPSVKIDVTYGCSHYLTARYEREVRDTYFICGSGIYVGSVLCNGDIYSCLDIERRPELIQGNIRVDDFVEVWENRFKEFRIDRSKNSQKCQKCKERRFCMGDSAHTWDYNLQQPLLCIKDVLDAEGV